MDDELKRKWEAEDKKFEEKLDKEAQEFKDEVARQTTDFREKVKEKADELGLTHYPSAVSPEEKAEWSKQSYLRLKRDEREVLKTWANRIDREGGTEPDKGRAN